MARNELKRRDYIASGIHARSAFLSPAQELCWLHGASRRARYLGYGAAWPLYTYIRDLRGNRGRIERAALATIGRLKARTPVSPDARDAWGRLQAVYPDDITAALFVYTGYYKDTVLSGIVRGRESHFVKVFATPDGHVEEAEHLDALLGVVPESISLAPLVHSAHGVAVYRLLGRSQSAATSASLLGAARDIGVSALHLPSAAPFASPQQLTDQTADLLAEFGSKVDGLAGLAQREVGPLPIAHGDFTPWNAFRIANGKLALVDYERVAPRAPFTDLWHVFTQPRALDRRAEIPEHLLASVADGARVSHERARIWYAAYLVEELHIDLTDWVVHDRKHPQLRDLIETKAAVLARVLDTVVLA